jgi:7-cyano-7-deazaguanine synthase in queuosine biosynthesis
MQAITYEHNCRVFYGPCPGDQRALARGRDFRIDETELAGTLCCDLPPLARDLMRIGMAVYVCDRLAKRDRHTADASGLRNIALAVQVGRPDFWLADGMSSLLQDSLHLLSDDHWRLSFFGPGGDWQRVLWRPPASSLIVCLYSGGLDSAAGLAKQLRSRKESTVAVTAWHQPRQKQRVFRHLAMLERRYARRLLPVVVKTALRHPPRMSSQETSQRCRSFMFAALGGAVACGLGSSVVEVYENGVGALNVPLMRDMAVAARATKSAHPHFFRLMGELTTRVAGRKVEFRLPFEEWTKAEIVRTLSEDGLQELARDSVSCVHYPRRVPGPDKSCGVCPACIGRRQALLTAGIHEDPRTYRYDLFGSPEGFRCVPQHELDYLKAILLQASYLAELEGGRLPSRLCDHLFGTGVIRAEEEAEGWRSLLLRYRQEWLELIQTARESGLGWTEWVGN